MSRHPLLSGRSAAVFRQFLDGRPDSLHPDDRRAAEQFWRILGELEPPEGAAAALQPRPRRLWIALAAAAVVAIAIPAWLLIDPQRTVQAHYAAHHGEVRSVQLADGSRVRLGAESQIALDYSQHERRITLLSGEAIFDVSKDPDRPFVVATAGGEVRALGTSFMVRVLDRESRLVVLEGTVQVTPAALADKSGAVSRVAKAGEMLTYGASVADRSGSSQAYVTLDGPADIERSTAWTHGMLYFHGEPLGEVVKIVNRYAEEPIVLDDSSLATTPVFAAMRVGDTAAIEAITER